MTQKENKMPTKKPDQLLLTGLSILFIGIIFLLFNLDVIAPFHNWWALFILIPIISMARNAWVRYQETSHFTSKVIDQMVSTTGLLIVMFIFLLDFDWGDIWPVFIILVGFSFIAKAMLKTGE